VLDAQLEALAKIASPDLLALRGVGVEVACTLLVAAGDNPERLTDEASFAALCGVSPVDASSRRQHRHRLNRGGNRDANRALWVIALVRLRSDHERGSTPPDALARVLGSRRSFAV
jgi:transposase